MPNIYFNLYHPFQYGLQNLIQLYTQAIKSTRLSISNNYTVDNSTSVDEQWYITEMIEINHAYMTDNT